MNRCVRNNNPLNIVRGKSPWKGLKAEQTDADFVQFENIVWGFRAAWVLFRTYLTRRGVQNLGQLIRRWCPDRTAPAYTKWVSRRSGVKVDFPLQFHEEYYEDLSKIMLNMARYEGYNVLTDEELLKAIKKGWDML